MSLLSKGPESSICAEPGILDGWVYWIVIVNVFLIIRFVTVGKFVGVFFAVALMLIFVLVSLLSKSPESGISSKSGILDRWVYWIIVINVFLIIGFVAVGKFVGVFFTVALVLHFMVMFFLGKSPESSVSTKSSILNGRINWIIIVNIFFIVGFVTVGKLIGVFFAVALVLFLVLMSLLSKGPKSSVSSKSSVLDRRINWIVIINVFLIIGFVSVSDFVRVLSAMALAMASALVLFSMGHHVVLIGIQEQFSLEAKSIVLNNIIFCVSLVFKLKVVLFISVGNLI
jgi:hypothetical protein